MRANELNTRDADPTDNDRAVVFWEWCLSCETTRTSTQLILIGPLVLVDLYCWSFYFTEPGVGQSRELMTLLIDFAATLICFTGAIHAARAICWESSPELRELVRLTGLGPLTLLRCKTMARWSTIGCALLALIPFACLARTFGGWNLAQIWAALGTLLMLAVLTASFALIAAVAATEVENSPTTATAATLVMLVLYHGLFWLTAGLLKFGMQRYSSQQTEYLWQTLYDFAWDSAPAMSILHANSTPETFSPLAPSYWMHFLTAMVGFRLASIVLVNRFRTVRRPKEFQDDAIVNPCPPHRPRCTDDPFLWKEFHVLAGGVRTNRRWVICYVIAACGIALIDVLNQNTALPFIVGMIAVCLWPVIFAARLDSLCAAEFRQQTWQALMLLPIDRRWIIWSKFRAIAWEQRPLAIPVATAIVFAWPHGTEVLVITALLAPAVGLVMCQAAVINHLLVYSPMNGPLPAGGAISFFATFIFMTAAAAGNNPWVGFIVTIVGLMVLMTTTDC